MTRGHVHFLHYSNTAHNIGNIITRRQHPHHVTFEFYSVSGFPDKLTQHINQVNAQMSPDVPLKWVWQLVMRLELAAI